MIRSSNPGDVGINSWEVGAPYPPNLELCLRLIAEGRLKVDELTTHTLSLTDIDAETSEMLAEPNGVLGVIIRMK